ncbi:tetratricopeptide repeat protein [Parasediminibacterium sp. JCM 36343]|uniref:tetratricopeptide repeat-containing sensor histidine kinase n=1 Tax=Parasediminibacterium sp. JCM 36343 TaxID=3374279 RepID=UPI003978BE3A
MKALGLIIILLNATVALCQPNWKLYRDSLLTRLAHQKEDSDMVETLLYIGNLYQANLPDSAMYYYQKGNEWSNKLNYTRGKLRFIACKVEILERAARFDEALQLTLQAVSIAEKANNPNMLGGAYNNVAEIYLDKGDIEKALLYYQKAVAVFESERNKFKLGIVYGNILGVYVSIEDREKAYQYALKAISNSREGHSDYGEAIGLENLSALLMKMKKYDSALLVSNQAYAIGVRVNDKTYQSGALSCINEVLLATNQLYKVEKNAIEIERLSTSVDDKQGVAVARYQLGQYYFKKKAYTQARRYSAEALAILTENKLRPILEDVHGLIGNIALATGNISLFESEKGLADSIKDAGVSNKILKYNQQLEAAYSLNKKQAEINNLNKEKEITALMLRQRYTTILVLAASLMVLGLLGFLYYRNSQQKSRLLLAKDALKAQRIRELEQEKHLLATESVLQGQEQERQRLAKDLHDGLGGILSSTKYSFSTMKNYLIVTEENAAAFERSMGMLDKSISELRRVAHNMMPEALMKFGLDTALQDFCTGITQSGALQLVYQSFEMDDATIPQSKASIIYRIIQELMNNTLKHAEAKNALVQIIRTGNSISITVEDDGKGFDVNILKDSNGIGYSNLQSRVAYLDGSIDIQSNIGKGTSVHIEIPDIAG